VAADLAVDSLERVDRAQPLPTTDGFCNRSSALPTSWRPGSPFSGWRVAATTRRPSLS